MIIHIYIYIYTHTHIHTHTHTHTHPSWKKKHNIQKNSSAILGFPSYTRKKQN